VEVAFGTETLLPRQRGRDRCRVVSFSASERPGQRMVERAVGPLLAEVRRRCIDTGRDAKPHSVEAGTVQIEGTRIDGDMTLFMPGLTGQAWLDRTTLPRSPGGFVQGTAACRVPGVARTYVAGDGGSFPGPEWMPKQAHQADLQAAVAARNLVRE